MTHGFARNRTDEAARQRLLARIGSSYSTVEERLTIGSVTLSFARVADPDSVLQQLDSDTSTWQPYWAEAWGSSRGVAEVLVDRDLADTHVLDLGCGLGLTGAVAAAVGARVVMVDAAPPALLFARLNAWPWRERVRVRRLNWRTDRLPTDRFALIVGSDVLYEPEEWPYLEAFWRMHLAPGGAVLLGEPGRRSADSFTSWLAPRGWTAQQSRINVCGVARSIRILEASIEPVP